MSLVTHTLVRAGAALAIITMATPPSTQPAQPDLGEALGHAKPQNPPACQHNANSAKRCKGFLDQWSNRTNAVVEQKIIGQLLNDKLFEKDKQAVGRRPGQALYLNMVRDDTIIDVTNFSVPPKGDRALVVARIVANMSVGQPLDEIYGTGPRSDSGHFLRKEFFLVAHDFAPDGTADPRASYKVSTWEVIGIDSVGPTPQNRVMRLFSTGKAGTFRLCAMPHDSILRSLGAQFMTCRDAAKLDSTLRQNKEFRAAVRNRSVFEAVLPNPTPDGRRFTNVYPYVRADIDARLTRFASGRFTLTPAQRARLLDVLMDVAEAPAWMPCGLGCCTGDT